MDDFLMLDLAILRREPRMGPSAPSTWSGWRWTWAGQQVRADLWLHEDRLDISMLGGTETIPFAWTQAGWGGRRTWFACPGCEGRARVIYRHNGTWRCRRCLGLTYASQYEDASDRLRRKATKLLRTHFPEHQMPASTFERMRPILPPKPKGLHWTTYWNLQARQLALSNAWLDRFLAEFNLDAKTTFSSNQEPE